MTSSSVDIDMDIWNFYMFCHCIGVIFSCHITSMVNGISCSSKTNKYMRVIFINFESQSIWLWVASLLQKTSDDRNLAKYNIFLNQHANWKIKIQNVCNRKPLQIMSKDQLLQNFHCDNTTETSVIYILPSCAAGNDKCLYEYWVKWVLLEIDWWFQPINSWEFAFRENRRISVGKHTKEFMNRWISVGKHTKEFMNR